MGVRVSRLRGRLGPWSTALAVAVTALAVGATGAVAGSLITSKDIKNGTIRGKDISNEAIGALKLKDKLRTKLNTVGAPGQTGATGPQGPQGPQGPEGPQGSPGPSGTAELTNPQWGLIARNTIGSAVAELRGGPYGTYHQVGTPQEELAQPPYGVGSLGIAVSDNALSGGTPQEKAAFGNEVDFVGDALGDIAEVGFHVFQTGENANISLGNLPNITFEIDPNHGVATTSYSSLVYLPDDIPLVETNRWSEYIDASAPGGDWYFTNGTLANETGCSQATHCDWDAIQAAVPDATLYSVQIVKGRDSAWVGAVDGLRLNDTVYDFEPFGVIETPVE